MADCIFCDIVQGEKEAEIVYQNDRFVAFKDVNPKAPTHILIVPKEHIVSINHLKDEHRDLMGDLLLIASKVADEVGVKERGYKLVFNVGRGGGQMVDHIHLHLLGGWENKEERDIPGMP